MSGLVRFIEAGKSAADWAAMIYAAGKNDRPAASSAARESIARAGYSIADEAAALEALYARSIQEARK
jgi:hypothetical protein